MLHHILFFIFATACIGGALNLLLQKHPINSALSLIVVMGALAALYLLLGAEFVAVIQVIIYAGAIMVLFVLVIMLLNAGEEEVTRGSQVAKAIGYPALLVVAGLLFYVLTHRYGQGERLKAGAFLGTTQDVGKLLFTDFTLPFEVTSVLILIAIMGAVVLSRREP